VSIAYRTYNKALCCWQNLQLSEAHKSSGVWDLSYRQQNGHWTTASVVTVSKEPH